MMAHCDEVQARFLLEAAGGNLELALQMALGKALSDFGAQDDAFGATYMGLWAGLLCDNPERVASRFPLGQRLLAVPQRLMGWMPMHVQQLKSQQ